MIHTRAEIERDAHLERIALSLARGAQIADLIAGLALERNAHQETRDRLAAVELERDYLRKYWRPVTGKKS